MTDPDPTPDVAPLADRPTTLGALKTSAWAAHAGRSVKDELRAALLRRLRDGRPIFEGIVGYDDTVVPQIVNALLARHNFILLGLRGQAKTRMLRQLTELLDTWVPALAGSELNDDPLAPVSLEGRAIVAEQGDVSGGLQLAIEALNAEPDAAAATAIMQELADAYPGTPEGHYGLARLAMRSGNFDVALDNARAATELRPDWLDAQLLYARTLLVAGRSEESLALGARLAAAKGEAAGERGKRRSCHVNSGPVSGCRTF